MGRPIAERTKGYANDCAVLSRIALAVEFDARITPSVRAKVVKALGNAATELSAVTDRIRKK